MALTIKLRQGLKAALPSTGMTEGEPLWCTNTQELYMATAATTKVPVAIDIAAFGAIGAIETGDLIYMYDISQAATAPKARKVTFGDLKTALNIPAASTDEKVATASGATAGYLGTDSTAAVPGTGVLRAGHGIEMKAGAANAFTTLHIHFPDQAQGDITYRGATNWTRLSAGTNGGILETQGSGANPRWINIIDGGTF